MKTAPVITVPLIILALLSVLLAALLNLPGVHTLGTLAGAHH